jgi:hypothetical protein
VDGVAALGGNDKRTGGVAGGEGAETLGNKGRGSAPGAGDGAVAVVRPSDAATEVAPTPGTLGSIKPVEPSAGLRGDAPEVIRLTSVVGRETGLAAC